MIIVNGKEIRDELLEKYKQEIENNNYHIKLAIIYIGEDEASKLYINNKKKICEQLNIECVIYKFKELSEKELKELIIKLNNDDSITGIMIELPLPQEFNTDEILDLIDPNKDVDGLTKDSFINTCTSESVLEILKYHNIDINKKITLVGYSKLIGKPLEKYFKSKGITPIICNSKTTDLKEKIKDSDIIITAVGKSNLITKDMVKENSIIIDCAITRGENGICGDVDYNNVKDKCRLITPVPNGVGPVNTAIVIKNLITLYKVKEIYNIFKENFPYISRKEKTLKEVISNEDNIILEKRIDNKLIGCSIVNKNTILLLVVDKNYRNKGIGTKLLEESERLINDKIILGVGFNYLMPGVPTSKKYNPSVNEQLSPLVNDNASNFFEKRGYTHSWGKYNCFDMKMHLKDFNKNEYSIGDTINGIHYRWATIDDLDEIIECADDACKYQDDKFSKYYNNEELYKDNNEKVLVAVKNNKIVGTLIISIETEEKNLGCVGCTCVSYNETHQKIGTNLVMLGTKYLKDIGLQEASLSYTYTGLDKLYGYSGYKISTYYFMGEKNKI